MSTFRIACTLTLVVLGLASAGGRLAWPGREDPSAGFARAGEPAGDPDATGWGARYGVAPDLAGLILTEARSAGVAPGLAFGLIDVESGFDPEAIGRHGERGLMQIKPSTARAYDRGITAEGLSRPEVNLRIGLEHLRREAEHFGNWSLGLAAYNAGRARVRRALASGGRPGGSYAARVLDHCLGACT